MTSLNIIRTASLIFKIFKYISLIGAAICIYGLGNSILKNYPLWINPSFAQGTIINYNTISWQNPRVYGSPLTTRTSANLPIVEFQSHDGKNIKFTDNFGHNILKNGTTVPVIYAKNVPSNAIVDKGVFNWMSTYIWLFGLFCSLLGVRRFNQAPVISSSLTHHSSGTPNGAP